MESQLIIYGIINGVVFFIYGIDKEKAIRNSYRIPEKILLLLAFFGPIGGFMGMQLFRHKTKKLKFKILVPAFLAMHLGLALFMTEASAAQEMPSDWAVPEYEEAIDEGYIIDELTNGFDEAITREAFTKLIIKTYEKIMGEIVNITQEDNPFTDTECMEVIKAYRMGIITGVDKNTFAPDERITREQLIVILVRMNRAIEIRSDKRILKYRNIDLEFGDVDLVEDWAYESFQIGVYNGLISGIGSNLLGPDNETTIEQAIVLNLRLAKFVEAYDEELVYDVAVASASEIQGQSGSVTVDILNMRSTPDLSSSANIIRKLKLNEEVTLLEKVGDWYHIYASGGLEGYVYCDYIRILGPDMERPNWWLKSLLMPSSSAEHPTCMQAQV